MKKLIVAIGLTLSIAGSAFSQSTVDLTPLGVPATIQAPSNVKTVAGDWSNLITDDKNFNISVEETSMTLADRKAEITANSAIQYLKTSENGFVYTENLMGRDLAHFEYIVTIQGISYRFYDKRVAPLDQAGVLPMYNAVLTLKEK